MGTSSASAIWYWTNAIFDATTNETRTDIRRDMIDTLEKLEPFVSDNLIATLTRNNGRMINVQNLLNGNIIITRDR